MKTTVLRSVGIRIACLFGGVAISLGIIELCLPFIFPSEKQFFVWQPGIRQQFLPAEEAFPGIRGPSWFVTNSEGMRGEEIPAGPVRRILAFGGSATECLYLDQRETWPYLVQEQLAKLSGHAVWVGNVGQSGRSSRHNLQQIRFLSRVYPQIREYLVLIGVNDLLLRLREGERYAALEFGTNAFDRYSIGHAFSRYPDDLRFSVYDAKRPLYKRSAVWNQLRLFNDIWRSSSSSNGALFFQDERGSGMVEARLQRKQAAPYLEDLPDLAPILGEYSANLKWISKIAKEGGIRLILITQPSMWGRPPGEVREELLWAGHSSGREYYSSAALGIGLSRFNETLRAVAQEEGVEVVDLENRLKNERNVFYDDMHFNELGARKVSSAIVEYIGSYPGAR